MEEWEYLEGHKDLYKDVLMENHLPLTSQGTAVLEPSSCSSSPTFSSKMVLLMNEPPRMNKDRNEITKRILNFILEILYLLTGEEYTIVKKTSGDGTTPNSHLHESGGWSRSQRPITEAPPHLPIHEQKILELTNKITELLAIEVPIRYQDVAVYFSMEEWEYLGRYKDLYKDVMMENHQPRKSQENPNKNSKGNALSSLNYEIDNENITCHSSGENLIALRQQSTNRGKKPHSCSECGKSFKSKSRLALHQRYHTGEKPYLCSECGKCFILQYHLNVHQRIHTGEKPYSCSECGTCFTNKSTLITHERTHTGEKPFRCSECGKCFMVKSNLVTHEKSHAGEKPYSCSECGKCFLTKYKFNNHQKLHKGDKPFTCSKCGKSFVLKSGLNKHQRIHTEEKPYSCSECGKCFKDKSVLTKHEIIHTGEKTFSCSECGKCFTTKGNLVTHERIHTGEKPFSCSECEKCFSRKSNLLLRERIHTGEKTY